MGYGVVHGGMGWCAVVCMLWWGSDVLCDAMVLMVWLVSHSICAVGACAGWVLVIMARVVRRCGMALGAATAAAVRIVRWLGFWRTSR